VKVQHWLSNWRERLLKEIKKELQNLRIYTPSPNSADISSFYTQQKVVIIWEWWQPTLKSHRAAHEIGEYEKDVVCLYVEKILEIEKNKVTDRFIKASMFKQAEANLKAKYPLL